MWAAFQKGKKKWFLDQDVRHSQWWWILCTSGKWTCDIFPSMMTLWRHIILFAYFLTQCLRQRTNSSCPFWTCNCITSGQLRNIRKYLIVEKWRHLVKHWKNPWRHQSLLKVPIRNVTWGRKISDSQRNHYSLNTLGPKWNIGGWILSNQH